MADVRLQIPDSLVDKINGDLGNSAKATDIAKEALTLYNWVAGERARGRVILSSTSDGENITRLAMPSLDINNSGTAKS